MKVKAERETEIVDGGEVTEGATINETSSWYFNAFATVTRIVPLYALLARPDGFIEMVRVAGVVALPRDAASHG